MTRLVSLLPCLALVACVAEDQFTVLILHNKVPDDECALQADEEAAFTSRGTLDLETSTQDYTFSPLLRNAAEGTDNPNQRIFFVQRADTELMGGTTQRSIDLVNSLGDNRQRTTLVSGAVSPNGGLTTLGYTLVDADQATMLGTGVNPGDMIQIVAATKVVGEIDGTTVETPVFNYPITLCKGCVVPGCFGDQDP